MCDPRGSILFVSDLYCGSISDNDICVKSGFFEYLESLMQRGYLHPGDSIMADKGFRIEDKLAEMGLKLNIPPFATSAHSMSAANVTLTRKIAAHRIHVERAINQIKNFSVEKSLSVYCTLLMNIGFVLLFLQTFKILL